RSRYVPIPTRGLWSASILFVLAYGLAIPGFAQENGGVPSFLLGTVSGDPGSSASIPLYYTPGKGQPIPSLHRDVEFVSNSVKFDNADKGTASSLQDFTLKTDSKELPPDKNLQRTRITIDIAVPDADPKKSLPEGLLAFLNFNVPTNAKSF